jgi:DNA-binding PadR family transcriptional regulator
MSQSAQHLLQKWNPCIPLDVPYQVKGGDEKINQYDWLKQSNLFPFTIPAIQIMVYDPPRVNKDWLDYYSILKENGLMTIEVADTQDATYALTDNGKEVIKVLTKIEPFTGVQTYYPALCAGAGVVDKIEHFTIPSSEGQQITEVKFSWKTEAKTIDVSPDIIEFFDRKKDFKTSGTSSAILMLTNKGWAPAD